jgi:hypothetical protein
MPSGGLFLLPTATESGQGGDLFEYYMSMVEETGTIVPLGGMDSPPSLPAEHDLATGRSGLEEKDGHSLLRNIPQRTLLRQSVTPPRP